MAKKPGTNPKGEFAFFNVLYEDDSQRSNRRVPAELLDRATEAATRPSTGAEMLDQNGRPMSVPADQQEPKPGDEGAQRK